MSENKGVALHRVTSMFFGKLLLLSLLITFVQSWFTDFLFILFLYIINNIHIGLSTAMPNYSCFQNNASIQFTFSLSPHSAWQPAFNCSLQKCNLNSNDSSNCRSSSTNCFSYLTPNNISYCAPGILCSILTPCDNITYSCESNTSVCVINSCCLPQRVCLPLAFTNFCVSGKNRFCNKSNYA